MSGEFYIIWHKHETANIPDAGIVANPILFLNFSFSNMSCQDENLVPVLMTLDTYARLDLKVYLPSH